jgi:DNA-binding protein YbaB
MTGATGATGRNRQEQAQRWVDGWAESFARKAERYQSVQQQVEQLRLTAASPDGMVRVTVGASGVPIDLELSERARSIPPTELSALILATMRRAQGGIPDQVAQIMRDTVGQDTSTIGSVVDEYRRQFPRPEGTDEPPRRRAGSRGDDDFGDETIMR